MRQARNFQSGDSVLVFDTQTKVNSNGIVKDIKGNNSYIVTIGDRDKHISGDHLSLISKDSRNNSDTIKDKNLILTIDSNDIELTDDDFSDNVSIMSDDSDIFLPVINSNVGNVPNIVRRKNRAEYQKLYDSLSNAFPVSRTRSGRI
ncbi:unnamed protein product [Meganyctiphanes norvegica]|uniref:Uncharacterized protein n=1 Tax=Meganyctiphanes norvegica TaxID=48144 RepID=A0AAV2PTW6_MEGNR